MIINSWSHLIVQISGPMYDIADVGGGHERINAEYADLPAGAGLKIGTVHPVAFPLRRHRGLSVWPPRRANRAHRRSVSCACTWHYGPVTEREQLPESVLAAYERAARTGFQLACEA